MTSRRFILNSSGWPNRSKMSINATVTPLPFLRLRRTLSCRRHIPNAEHERTKGKTAAKESGVQTKSRSSEASTDTRSTGLQRPFFCFRRPHPKLRSCAEQPQSIGGTLVDGRIMAFRTHFPFPTKIRNAKAAKANQQHGRGFIGWNSLCARTIYTVPSSPQNLAGTRHDDC